MRTLVDGVSCWPALQWRSGAATEQTRLLRSCDCAAAAAAAAAAAVVVGAGADHH